MWKIDDQVYKEMVEIYKSTFEFNEHPEKRHFGYDARALTDRLMWMWVREHRKGATLEEFKSAEDRARSEALKIREEYDEKEELR